MKRRVRWLFTAFGAVLCLTFLSSAQTNLVPNGDFEMVVPDGESIAAAGWSLSKSKDTVTADPLTFDSAGTLGLDSTEVHGGKYSLKLSMTRENPNPDVYKNWEVKAVYNFPDALLSHLTPGLVLEVQGFAKNTHVAEGNMGQVAIFLWQPKTWKVVKPMTTMADWTDISNQVTLPDTLNEVTQGALFVLAHHVGDMWVDDLQVIVPPLGVIPLRPSATTTPDIDFVNNQAVFSVPTGYELKVLAPNGRVSGHAVGFGERAVFNTRQLVPGRYIVELTTPTGGRAVQPLSIVR